jgi:hypothetical protein
MATDAAFFFLSTPAYPLQSERRAIGDASCGVQAAGADRAVPATYEPAGDDFEATAE